MAPDRAVDTAEAFNSGSSPYFANWLRHRAVHLGLDDSRGLGPAAGIASTAMAQVQQSGSLSRLSRTNRICLAQALRVSLRDLESLADGRASWIADDHIVDPAAVRRSKPHAEEDSSVSTSKPLKTQPVPAEEGHGVPIVGSVHGWSSVQFDNLSEPLSRLGVRYVGMPTTFALRVVSTEPIYAELTMLVLRSVPPVHLQPRQRVLVTCTDGSAGGVTYLGVLASSVRETTTRLAPLGDAQAELKIDSESIVRAACWVETHGRRPPDRSRSVADPRK